MPEAEDKTPDPAAAPAPAPDEATLLEKLKRRLRQLATDDDPNIYPLY